MKIDFIHIHNFRKLKSCRIDLANQETIFVGANNSGKTSAMDALITFFKSKDLTTRDFTLSNWQAINGICEAWEKESDPVKRDRSIAPWENYLPALDVWLTAQPSELHQVSHLIPTLDWKGGALGVRLRYEPKDLDNLCQQFCTESANSKKLSLKDTKPSKYKFWPKDMWHYLDRDKQLSSHFEMRAYLLNPADKDVPDGQSLPNNAEPLSESAFNGIVKVDIINAQRGFTDVNNEAADTSRVKSLSSQLRLYYEKHLNPTLKPTVKDVAALEAIEDAKEIFDNNLKESFSASLGELKDINYPGFGNPNITLSSRFSTVDSLNHEASVYYDLGGGFELSLPEKYNGLGYQNLISMIFKLIRFRDEWMQVGKSAKSDISDPYQFEPLHLVLIEEPEAHLHAQVQQVFIKEAYKVLRRHDSLKDKKQFHTQLVISTHSNHIAHEIDFTALRYFKRGQPLSGTIPTSTVVNLTETFGTSDDSTKFAIRYLRATHCDLFFADAVILVEGPAERMLVPHFIKHYTELSTSYISILEIGGSHAHTLKPLIEKLGIIALIISDIDSVDPKASYTKVQPETGKGYLTGNNVIKTWLPCESSIDTLLKLDEAKKVHATLPIKIAYQIPVQVVDGKTSVAINPYTFEDSLVLENRDVFAKMTKGVGLLKQMVDAAKTNPVSASGQAMYKAITKDSAKKAEFALELLFYHDPDEMKMPVYIQQGLNWLATKLEIKKPVLPTEKETKNGKGKKSSKAGKS